MDAPPEFCVAASKIACIDAEQMKCEHVEEHTNHPDNLACQ